MPIIDDEADLVIPERTSMGSYPVIQQAMEPLSNEFFRLLTNREMDIMFGSRSWSRGINYIFSEYDGEHGDKWDSIYVPMIDAMKLGKRVKGVKIDYMHPAIQREVEDRNMVQDAPRRVSQHVNINGAMEKRWKGLH